MLNRRLVGTCVTLTLVVSLAGCAGVPQKFTRKQKPREIKPVAVSQQPYAKEFTNKYYYTMHFTHWKTWQTEMLKEIGGNAKRRERTAQEVLSNLEEMQKLLLEPKRSELGRDIDTVRGAVKTLVDDKSQAAQGRARMQLERTLRTISSGFYYGKVAVSVLPDEPL